MSPIRFGLSAVIVLLALTNAIHAQEKVENPTYASWNKFKPGTAVKYKNTNKVTVMGNEIVTDSDLIMTLAEATPEKVVIDYETITRTMGMEFKAPPSRQEFPRLIELKPGQKKENVGKPDSVFEEGSATVKVAAGEFKTKWHKSKAQDRVLQSWVSDTVPGTLVKTVTELGAPAPGTNVLELVEIKKP